MRDRVYVGATLAKRNGADRRAAIPGSSRHAHYPLFSTSQKIDPVTGTAPAVKRMATRRNDLLMEAQQKNGSQRVQAIGKSGRGGGRDSMPDESGEYPSQTRKSGSCSTSIYLSGNSRKRSRRGLCARVVILLFSSWFFLSTVHGQTSITDLLPVVKRPVRMQDQSAGIRARLDSALAALGSDQTGGGFTAPSMLKISKALPIGAYPQLENKAEKFAAEYFPADRARSIASRIPKNGMGNFDPAAQSNTAAFLTNKCTPPASGTMPADILRNLLQQSYTASAPGSGVRAVVDKAGQLGDALKSLIKSKRIHSVNDPDRQTVVTRRSSAMSDLSVAQRLVPAGRFEMKRGEPWLMAVHAGMMYRISRDFSAGLKGFGRFPLDAGTLTGMEAGVGSMMQHKLWKNIFASGEVLLSGIQPNDDAKSDAHSTVLGCRLGIGREFQLGGRYLGSVLLSYSLMDSDLPGYSRWNLSYGVGIPLGPK